MKQIVSRLVGFAGSLLLLAACATPQAAAPAASSDSSMKVVGVRCYVLFVGMRKCNLRLNFVAIGW